MPEIPLPTKIIQDQIDARVLQILNQVNQKNTGKTLRQITYTVGNHTFGVPSGVTEVYLTGGGAGGGGATTQAGISNVLAQAGGLTSFGDVILSGGGPGLASAFGGTNDWRRSCGGYPGGPGGEAGESPVAVSSGTTIYDGKGGNSGPYFGGRPTGYTLDNNLIAKVAKGGYCSGGAGISSASGAYFNGGGGGGDFVHNHRVIVTPLTNYPIVVGKGGLGGGGSVANAYGNSGGDGILTVSYWA